MKKVKKIIYIFLGILLLLSIVVFGMIYLSMQPTSGKKIESYNSPIKAIIVVDIQEDYTGKNAKKPFKDAEKIIDTTNELIQQAEANGMIVVFIQNVIKNPVISLFTGGINAPGAPGTEMDRRLIRIPGIQTFSKNRSDAFSNNDFDDYLRKMQVNHLLITGLDAAYCINATIRGALNRGYQVTVFKNGIATESSKSIDALTTEWQTLGVSIKEDSKL